MLVAAIEQAVPEPDIAAKAASLSLDSTPAAAAATEKAKAAPAAQAEDENAPPPPPAWDVRNAAGRGPMSEAQMNGQEKVVQWLLERMVVGANQAGSKDDGSAPRDGQEEEEEDMTETKEEVEESEGPRQA